MKDWKKAVLWTLVGFCMISVIVSIFGLVAFLQMAATEISSIFIVESERSLFVISGALAVVFAVVCVVLIAVVIMFIAKGKQLHSLKLMIVFLVVTFVISLFFTIFAFCTVPILEKDNINLYRYTVFFYGTFVHCQSYLSAVLSTFVPLMIADGILLGYLIHTKKQKQEGTSETSVSDPQ
ncbi:MAG: hypothetical protein J1F71_03490 [Clostridiales bacterium]|nr:hypothetical protein [Clostridiales bacterium]